MSYEEFETTVPRHAFGPRETARAAGIWRLLQDAAIVGSTRRGWPMKRYAEEGCAFVVRGETVQHQREIHFDEAIRVSTWVSTFARGLISDRQVRVHARDGGELLVAATQEWVHVEIPAMKARRAGQALLDSFVLLERDADVRLPAVDREEDGTEREFTFRPWWTSMDTLGHANHPDYLQWCEEAVARLAVDAGLDSAQIVPVAEQVRYSQGVVAPQRVSVRTQLRGFTAGGQVLCAHRILDDEGRLCARATTVRRMLDGDDGALADALA